LPIACSGFPLTPPTGAGLKLIRMKHQLFRNITQPAVGPSCARAINPGAIRNAA